MHVAMVEERKSRSVPGKNNPNGNDHGGCPFDDRSDPCHSNNDDDNDPPRPTVDEPVPQDPRCKCPHKQ